LINYGTIGQLASELNTPKNKFDGGKENEREDQNYRDRALEI